jgi:hypothetical protein
LKENVMPASLQATQYPYPIAFSIQLGRNLIVQGLGLSMVSLMGLSILPWPVVLGWTVLTIASISVEHRLLRHIGKIRRLARRGDLRAPALRTLTTTLYALAAFALFAKGGQGVRLFAFALMSASMVHVLMRHYQTPLILTASLSPYILIMGVVGVGLARTELARRHVLTALAPLLTIAMVAVQFCPAGRRLERADGHPRGGRRARTRRRRCQPRQIPVPRQHAMSCARP